MVEWLLFQVQALEDLKFRQMYLIWF